MNRIQLPVAIHTTAAALALFMTVATLNSLVMVAEPQQSALIAQTTALHGAHVASALRQIEIVAQAPLGENDH
jgi:hypothetical protein